MASHTGTHWHHYQIDEQSKGHTQLSSQPIPPQPTIGYAHMSQPLIHLHSPPHVTAAVTAPTRHERRHDALKRHPHGRRRPARHSVTRALGALRQAQPRTTCDSMY